MKNAFLLMSLALLSAIAGLGQTPAQPQTQAGQQSQPQVYGRGRGGLPWAWNDTNRDGICDATGQPVGQGRPIGFGRGRGPCGRGLARGSAGWGRGAGWWRGRGYASATPPVRPPAEVAPAQPQSPQK